MIQKIKDLMKTKEDLDAINGNIEENNRIISELKEELKSLKAGLKETKSRRTNSKHIQRKFIFNKQS